MWGHQVNLMCLEQVEYKPRCNRQCHWQAYIILYEEKSIFPFTTYSYVNGLDFLIMVDQ